MISKKDKGRDKIWQRPLNNYYQIIHSYLKTHTMSIWVSEREARHYLLKYDAENEDLQEKIEEILVGKLSAIIPCCGSLSSVQYLCVINRGIVFQDNFRASLSVSPLEMEVSSKE